MSAGAIFDIKRYAIHDGPGIRTTVFLQGCPLHCRWCHNPEGLAESAQRLYNADRCIGCNACVLGCPNQALVPESKGIRLDRSRCKRCFKCVDVCPAEAVQRAGRQIGAHELLKSIGQDRLFFDESGGGVTFSGGEPLSQAAFLLEMLEACGRCGIHRAVDTSGCADSNQLLAVAGQTDLFLYDLKIMDSSKHLAYTGVSNESILANLELLAARGAEIEIRIPVIPGVNDDDENIDQTAEFIVALPGVQRVHLLSYHDTARKKYRQMGIDFITADIPRPAAGELQKLAAKLKGFGLQVSSGG